MKQHHVDSNLLINSKLKKKILEHLRALMNSLGQLSRSLSATLLTISVIGVALALPLGLFVVLKNMEAVGGNLNNTSQISLYLSNGTSDQEAENILRSVSSDESVTDANYVSPSEGLSEFSQSAHFGDVLKDLKTNPLPGVIVVTPAPNLLDWQLTQLVDRLQHLPDVESVQLDMQWLQRLDAILAIGHRTATLLMILFSFAVLLIIGNTIRLTTQNHHDEILIIKIIGGTHDFIRRPFLYSGMLYGLAGAIVAWFLVDFSIFFLQGTISKLASLYGTEFDVVGLGFASTLSLLIGSVFLGWLASWLAVNRYIYSISKSGEA